jgi:hypothetical protein
MYNPDGLITSIFVTTIAHRDKFALWTVNTETGTNSAVSMFRRKYDTHPKLNAKPTKAAVNTKTSIAALLATACLTGIVAAAATVPQRPLATKGSVSVSMEDVRANNPLLTAAEFDQLRQNPQAFRQNVEEVANGRMAAIRLGEEKTSEHSENSRARRVAQDRAALTTALATAERQGREAAIVKPADIEARAKEIYESTDAAAIKTALSADVQVIIFDVTKRSIDEINARIAEIRKTLTDAKADFGGLAIQYSDDDLTSSMGGKIEKVPASGTSDVVSRELFGRLKPDEVSRLLPHPRGLMMVKLLKIHQPEKRPYDQVMKDAAVKRAESEAGQLAREKRREELLGESPLVIHEEAFNAALITPDMKALQLWREAEAKKQAQTATSGAPSSTTSSIK